MISCFSFFLFTHILVESENFPSFKGPSNLLITSNLLTSYFDVSTYKTNIITLHQYCLIVGREMRFPINLKRDLLSLVVLNKIASYISKGIDSF